MTQKKSFVPDWVKDAIFYQIFPERFANGDPTNDPKGVQPWGGVPMPKNYFGGDLKGITDHLDYIASLGVNVLYLNPIFESNSNHKYHAKDFLKIDPHFGDEKVFKTFVDESHKRGIKIILDGVWNHTGIDFFPFEDVKAQGADSEFLGWFNIYSLPIGTVNKPNYECWWGYGDLPKLMTHNPDVRNYLFQVTEHWMKFGIDGWRLDVPNEIPHQFWIEWRQLVKSLNPDAYIVGEIWDDATPWLKGDQFDATMNYRFREACIDFFLRKNKSAKEFDKHLAQVRSDYPEDVAYVLQNLLGSHDTERFLTLADGDVKKVQLAWLFQMTYVGAPMIYYGDEIGMKGGKDPGCRGTMIWEDEWRDLDMLDYLRNVTKLRNEFAALRRGTFETLVADEKQGIYAFARELGNESVVVVINNSKEQRDVPLPPRITEAKWTRIFPATSDVKGISINSVKVLGMSGQIYLRK